jgi:hypothetical protein
VTRSRTAELARGLTAALAIAALVVLPPILLTRFIGWPLPHNPNLDDITHSLRGTPISDQVLLKVLAIAGWVAWANALACLIAEVIAWRRQRTAAHVPLGGLFQPLISQLVLSVGLLLTTARTLTPTPTSAAIQLRPPVLAVAVQETPAPPPTSAASTELPTCVVQRRDSLWVLAERHLGDGLRWREIYDLNQGLPQPGGRSLRDPNLIRPGWTLRLPADAVDIVPPVPVVPAPPDPPAPASGTPATSPPPTLPAASPTSAPQTTVPAITATTAASTAVPPTTSSPPTSVSATDTGDDADDQFPVPVALTGATLLAAALVLKLDALRRRQMRRRPPGHTIPTASSEASQAERLLRAAAAKKPASRLDVALRLLANQLAEGTPTDCRIDTVRVADDNIEILLTSASDAPDGPFEVMAGRAWTLPTHATSPELEETAARQTAPTPALVTVGRLGDADVLIDLETTPLTITGDLSIARRVLWSITAELATSPWADDLQLLYVGTPPTGFAGLDRVESLPTVAAAAHAVSLRSAPIQRALSSAGYSDPWSARLANHGDGWPPTIVVIATEDDSGDAPGASVVRISDHAEVGARNLVVDDQGCRLEPLGLRLALPGLPAELIEPTEELISTALDDEPGPEIDLRVPVAARYVAPPELRGPDEITPATEGVVLVRILGPVVIDGAPAVNRRRVKELIVYLALHPEGVTTEQITAALWPGDTPTRAAFNQTVTRARAALGDDPDGQPYIGYVHDGRYRPSRYLLCDAILLEQAVARDGSTGGVETSGQPFAATPGFEWAYVEGHAYRAAALLESLPEHVRLG